MFIRKLLATTATIALGTTMIGCTKESPTQLEPKFDVLEKSSIDTNSVYLYVASQGSNSRTTAAGRPHAMGEPKLVKLEWAKDALNVVQIEADDRFKENKINSIPVLSIPVEHLDYDCGPDRFGECSNKEAVNDKIDWMQKTKFRPNFNAIKFQQISLLPVDLMNYIFSCYEEIGSEFVGTRPKLEADAINFQIERSYKSTLFCLDDSVEDLKDATFKAVSHYSLVKLDSVATPGYKPVVYPQKDESEFGFFTTDVKSLDVDNRDVVKGKITYMNRWSPTKSKIVYHMSDSFNEFPKLKAATRQAVNAINTALSKANLDHPMQIDLREPSGIEPGDIRNNSIVLVKEPLASRVIGYGPSAANPRTGELIQGRTVMYLGTIKTTIRNAYNEYVSEVMAQQAKAQGVRSYTFAIPGINQTETNAVPASFIGPLKGQEKLSIKVPKTMRSTGGLKQMRHVDLVRIEKEARDYTRNAIDYSKEGDLEEGSTPEQKAKMMKSRLQAMSEQCFYPAELFNFEGALVGGLDELKKLGIPLVPWDSLNDTQKEQVLDVMVPYVWIPTLVHELGHNLGLRHNFNGSEDKANYYSQEELKQMGIDHEIHFASVMDYPYSSLHELPTLGKYDIAALRFGLARKVEMADGTLKTVPHTLADLTASGAQLKPYGFCTDEHVDANPGCKRFDEGTTLGEITQHYAKTFDTDFKRRNFRNGLRNYSLMSEGMYGARVDMTLHTIRLPFELYTRILNEFDVPPELWETEPFLKDLRLAVTTAAGVYQKVLKTPDITCAIALKTNPTQIIAAAPVGAIDPRAADCSEVSLRPEYEVAGQAGRSFKSKKLASNDNPYVDQIDIRGIWVDKMLALKYLTNRKLGSKIFDGYTENYLQDGKTAAETFATLEQLAADDFAEPVTFEAKDGQTFTGRIRYSLADTHIIDRPLDGGIVRLTGLGDSALPLNKREYEVPFMKEVVRTVRREARSAIHQSHAQQVLEIFQVFTDKLTLEPGQIAAQVRIGTMNYYAQKENTIALMSIRAINTIRDLEQVAPADLQKVSVALKADPNAQPPAGSSEAIKKAYTYKAEVIDAFMRGGLKDEAYHSRMLSQLVMAWDSI